MQCKDISDKFILEFLLSIQPRTGTWFWCDGCRPSNSVISIMPQDISSKLVLAKMRILIKRGLVDGCGCGCRGDFSITEKGIIYLNIMKIQEIEMFYPKTESS